MADPDGALASIQTILVTGGAGFVGANLCLHLAQRGHRVVVYDLQPPPPIVYRYWEPAGPRLVFESGSVTDAPRLAEVAAQHSPAVVVHAAAVTTVNTAAEARAATQALEVNLLGTVRLLDLARDRKVRRFVYISSGGVYGSTDPNVPLTEHAPLQLRTLYAIAKATSERICLRYRDLFDLDVVVGRLGQPFGPMERDTGARSVLSTIFQMARAAIRGGRVRLPKPDYSCDWTYTADLAKAVRRLVETPDVPNTLYNLSSSRPYRLSEAAAHLGELIEGARFVWVDGGGDIDIRSDPQRGPMDNTRLRQDLGFEPAYDLRRGLEAALPWWREIVHAA